MENMAIIEDEYYETGVNILSKSNIFINSKFKATLNCQKILYTSLLRLQMGKYYINENNQMTVEMYPKDILDALNIKAGGSIYSNLKPIARQMSLIPMGVTDPENERFSFWTLVSKAEYENGVFTVNFNNELQKYLLNVSAPFTKLSKNIMMSWQTVYAYRLYELLKQCAFYSKDYKGAKNGIFKKEFDIYELRLLLGVVNSALHAVQTVLDNTNPPDYKKACEASPEKLYPTFAEFKRRVIDVGVNEINESANEGISDIRVKYKTKSTGHNKVYAIEFYIYDLTLYKDKSDIENISATVKNGKTELNLSDEQKFMITMETFELFSVYKLGYTDITTILETAMYDINVVKKAKLVVDQANNVKDILKYTIAAIKNNWDPKENNADFIQRDIKDIDFEELEQKLLKNKRI